MTNPDNPTGKVTASFTANSSYEIYKAFDSLAHTAAYSSSCGKHPAWIQYEFSSIVDINKIIITARSYADTTNTYKIQYSIDGDTWNDYTDNQTISSLTSYITSEFNNEAVAKYIRYYEISNSYSDSVTAQIQSIQAYGSVVIQ